MEPYANWPDYQDRSSTQKVPDEATLRRLAMQASEWMDYVTFDRVSAFRGHERVITCCVRIVDYLWAISQFMVEGKGIISSESVAGWRISYSIPAHLSPDNPQQGMTAIAQQYLTRVDGHNLMFNGL